jgi:hypothetical protein
LIDLTTALYFPTFLLLVVQHIIYGVHMCNKAVGYSIILRQLDGVFIKKKQFGIGFLKKLDEEKRIIKY